MDGVSGVGVILSIVFAQPLFHAPGAFGGGSQVAGGAVYDASLRIFFVGFAVYSHCVGAFYLSPDAFVDDVHALLSLRRRRCFIAGRFHGGIEVVFEVESQRVDVRVHGQGDQHAAQRDQVFVGNLLNGVQDDLGLQQLAFLVKLVNDAVGVSH